jgi:hypothetical protein
MNSKRIQSAALAVAATVTLIAGAVSPAMAAGNDPAKKEAKQEKPAAPEAKSDTKTYCVKDTLIGSRVPKRVCHTRAEWIAINGTDPAAN